MYLPFELVNIDRRQPTNAYYNQEETSSIKWSIYDCNFEFKEDPLSKVDYKEWYKFVKWLRLRDIITVFDFDQYIQWLWKTNYDRIKI